MKILTSQQIAEKYILGIGNDALNDKHAIECLKEDINNLVLEELRKNGLLGYPMAEQETKEPIKKECEHPKSGVTTENVDGDIYSYCTNCKKYL